MNNIYDGLYEKLAHVQGLLCKQEIYGCTEYGQICDTGREQGRVLAMLKIKPEISTGDRSWFVYDLLYCSCFFYIHNDADFDSSSTGNRSSYDIQHQYSRTS